MVLYVPTITIFLSLLDQGSHNFSCDKELQKGFIPWNSFQYRLSMLRCTLFKHGALQCLQLFVGKNRFFCKVMLAEWRALLVFSWKILNFILLCPRSLLLGRNNCTFLRRIFSLVYFEKHNTDCKMKKNEQVTQRSLQFVTLQKISSH